jgi:lysine-specific demethylase 8
MTVSSPMPRVHRPSPGEFRNFVERREPVVIEGALDGWRALSAWTFERLKTLHGNAAISVQSRVQGDAHPFSYRDVPFDVFIDSLENGAGCDYLAGYPLLDRVAPLWADIQIPSYAGPLTVSPRAYIGPRGSRSSLHFDLSHSLSAQIVGRKKVVVLAFRRRDMVLDPDLRRPGWLIEPLDVESPHATGPRGLVPRQRWECTLEPGDLLFLPSRRHHLLRSLDATISLSFFWHTALMRAVRRSMALLGRPVL